MNRLWGVLGLETREGTQSSEGGQGGSRSNIESPDSRVAAASMPLGSGNSHSVAPFNLKLLQLSAVVVSALTYFRTVATNANNLLPVYFIHEHACESTPHFA